MLTNLPVPYDLCIGVPISHLLMWVHSLVGAFSVTSTFAKVHCQLYYLQYLHTTESAVWRPRRKGGMRAREGTGEGGGVTAEVHRWQTWRHVAQSCRIVTAAQMWTGGSGLSNKYPF